MIYKGMNRTGEIETVKAHGGSDVAEVYGGINEANPIYYKTRTLTGQTPLSYKALGKPLSDYIISGKTVQDGTPSPDAPVDVVGCGVRTENLFDWSTVTTGYRITWATGVLIEDETAIMSDYIRVSPGIYRANASFNLVGYDANKEYVGTYDPYSYTFRKEHGSKTSYYDLTNANVAYVKLMSFSSTDTLSASTMLNYGPAALPYAPYGFKLPLTVNGTEYSIYLGQVPTTRRVKKLVLTGEDNFGRQNISSADPSFARFSKIFQFGSITSTTAILYASTHFIGLKSFGTSSSTAENCFDMRFSNGTTTIMIVTNAATDATSFNQWLSDQYAAGTPVTIWYVLETPETGIVNEPLNKIGAYADTISMAQAGVTIPTIAGANTLTIDTTVQPSEVSITGNIKEVQGT